MPVPVFLPDVNAAQGSVISVPVTVGALTGLGVSSYDMQVSFDSTVVQPASPAFDVQGTLSGRMSINPNSNTPGHLFIAASQNAPPIAGSGVLIYLRFTIVGTSEQSTGLAFENWRPPGSPPWPWNGFWFSEGNPASTTTNGSVTVADAAVAGTVTYSNANGAPPFVSDVIISGSGSIAGCLTRTNFLNGGYLLSGFGTSSYTVTPSKTGGVNGAISSFDAARISQHVGGTVLLTGNQLIVADVSGNGTLSSFDAGNIARYVADVADFGSTGNWIFDPASRSYPSVASIISGENYSALLMGEVSGNWNGGAPRPAGTVNSEQRTVDSEGIGPERGIAVELPSFVGSVDKEIVVPVSVQGIADKGVISYEFDLRYDPSVMQPLVEAVDVKGTVSRGLSVVTNAAEPGLLRVVVYGAYPIDGDGVLLNLRFTSVGGVGSVSPISFGRIMFNEGEPRVVATDGKIELLD